MAPESLFSLASFVVLPGWLLLVFVPRWRWSARLVSGLVIPCLLGALYALVLVPRFGGAQGGPIGLLLYLVIRGLRTRRLGIDETSA